MTLFAREEFEAFVSRLPHVFIVHQWGNASVAKVGRDKTSKIFALHSDWSSDTPSVSFKCSQMSFDMLPTLNGVRPAPYLARAKWVQVAPHSELDAHMLESYVVAAHALAYATLPRAVRNTLSLPKPVA